MINVGYFNNRDHDRQYNAQDISMLFDGIINDGIFKDYMDGLKVIQNGGGIAVSTGRCWVNHTWMLNDSEYSVILEPNNSENNRIDAIVIDADLTDDVRETSIKVVTGEASVEKKYPPLKRESYHMQYPLAYVTVKPGDTPIEESDIDDRRGKSTIKISDDNIYYGTPFVILLLGNSGIKTNLPGIAIEGFQFEQNIIEAQDMIPNVLYGLAEKIE